MNNYKILTVITVIMMLTIFSIFSCNYNSGYWVRTVIHKYKDNDVFDSHCPCNKYYVYYYYEIDIMKHTRIIRICDVGNVIGCDLNENKLKKQLKYIVDSCSSAAQKLIDNKQREDVSIIAN